MDLSLIIEARLLTDEDFLYKCLLLLYSKQEDDEQIIRSTIHQNGHGFNTADSVTLSRYAEDVKLHGNLEDGVLSRCRKLMKKYSKQLTQYLTVDEIL